MNSSDKKSFSPIKTTLKITILSLFICMLTMIAIIDAPVDFEKECVIYTEIDEEKGVVITLPDNSYKIIQVTAGDCKQPVQDGVFNNMLHHAPFDFWFSIFFIIILSILITCYIHDLLKHYILNKKI